MSRLSSFTTRALSAQFLKPTLVLLATLAVGGAWADYFWGDSAEGTWGTGFSGSSGNYVLNSAKDVTVNFDSSYSIASGVWIENGTYTVTFKGASTDVGLTMTGSADDMWGGGIHVGGWGGNGNLIIDGGSYTIPNALFVPFERKGNEDDPVSATFELKSGVVSAGALVLGREVTCQGTVTLSGGTFSTPTVYVDGGSGTLEFDGGTLQASAEGTLIASGVTVTVGADGGTIDVGANAVTIAAPVSGTGTITVKGTGSLTFIGDMSGFCGAVVVETSGCTVTLPASATKAVPGANTSASNGVYSYSANTTYNDWWTGNTSTDWATAGNWGRFLIEEGTTGYDINEWNDNTINFASVVNISKPLTITENDPNNSYNVEFTASSASDGLVSTDVLNVGTSNEGMATFTSGTYSFNNMYVGGSGASGNVIASGATIKIATTGSMNDPEIGNGDGGSLTISDGTVYLGIATSVKWTKVNGGTINLDGGELQIGSIRYIGGSPVVNFNGGTLYQYGNTWNGNEIIENNGNWTLNVLAGGAKIYVPEKPASNFDGATTTISQELKSGVEAGDTDGGLTKLGPGTLILAVAPTFNGGITLHEGSIVIPDTYPEVNVTTDVSGYQVSVTPGDGVKTFTCTKIPVIWQGDEDSNWNTPGNWDGGAVPTASDDVVIPANSTITLDAAANAATIIADETVTITSSGLSNFANIKDSLKNSSWKGVVSINGTDSNSAPSIADYGNALSTIELNGLCINRFHGAFSGTFKVTGNTYTRGTYATNGRTDYRRNYAIVLSKCLIGNGVFTIQGTQPNNFQNVFIENAADFSGSLYTYDNYVAFRTAPSEKGTYLGTGIIRIDDSHVAGLGLGAVWNPAMEISIAGTIKVQFREGYDSTIATLKAPTVTFENGATIQYAKLGTIALVNASDEGIAPSGSGTVNIAFGDGVTLADGVQLMSWAADATPDNVTFAFSDSSLNDDWKLTASETGLVLNTKHPVASVDGMNYGSLAEALENASESSSIVLKVNSAEAITLKGTQTLTIDSGVVYTGALTISSPTESETVAPTLVLNAATTVSSVTVGDGATFALPSDYTLLTGENVLTIGGAGWVKFTDNNSSAYSAVAISVPEGTLEFAAGSTFKDIAAGTVYVNGTVTGTTLDAEGNISNGSTLFTLAAGTFANNTVTVYVNDADTTIHFTNTAGVYTAGKTFYWRGGTYSHNSDNWSDVSLMGAASGSYPVVFDTAVLSEGCVQLNDEEEFNVNILVSGNSTIQDSAGTTYKNVYVGRKDGAGNSLTTITILSGRTLTLNFSTTNRISEMHVYGKIIGSGSLNTAIANNRGAASGVRLYDTNSFVGDVKLTQTTSNQYNSIKGVNATNNSSSKWSISEDGVASHRIATDTADSGNKNRDWTEAYTPFALKDTDYYFGVLKAWIEVSGTSGKGYANNKTRLHLGEKFDEDSWLKGSWYSTEYQDCIYWKAKTATFTHEIKNTYLVALMGGGDVKVSASSTEGAADEFVPSVIKFLEFTDSNNVVRKGGYLTIDDDNAAIAGDIVNAIAAAGTGETQAVAGFNVTAADEVTAAVTDWSALAASGITKKGTGTLALTGTPSAFTGTTTVEAGTLVIGGAFDTSSTVIAPGATLKVLTPLGDPPTVSGDELLYKVATATEGDYTVYTVAESIAVDGAPANIFVDMKDFESVGITAGMTDAEKSAALEATADNGLAVWQNYVMNIEGNATQKFAAVVTPTTDATMTVATSFGSVDGRTGAGVKVTYKLMKKSGETWVQVGDPSTRPSFSVDPSTLDANARLKIQAVFAE